MANILLIQSSIFGEQSRSLGLAREFLKRTLSGSIGGPARADTRVDAASRR